MKTCTRCKQEKAETEFTPDKRRKSQLQAACKACCAEWQRSNNKKASSIQQRRERHLQKNYGKSVQEYEALHSAQRGLCAICSMPGNSRGLFVDHCHVTGDVRGLLCHKCNVGIGFLGDDLSGIINAAQYLSKSEPTLFPGIWKRIPSQTIGSIYKPSDPVMPNACSESRSLNVTIGDACTADLATTSPLTM